MFIFKGKPLNRNYYVYGGYTFVESLEKHFIITHDGCEDFDKMCFDFVEVDPKTIEQSEVPE